MRDLTINAYDIMEVHHEERQDTAPEDQKRVELHLHTNMSQMDAPTVFQITWRKLLSGAKRQLQLLIMVACKPSLKRTRRGKRTTLRFYTGVEADIVADGTPIAYNEQHVNLKDATYVVFDTETTGLSARYNKVIELAAGKMKNGTVIDQFEQFIDPGHPLSERRST